MEAFEYIETISKIIYENKGSRKIVLYRCLDNETNILLKENLSKYGCSVDIELSEDSNIIDEKTIFHKEYINGGKDNYYILIWNKYSENLNKWLISIGYEEIQDYIFKIPKPIRLSGNMAQYNDNRGNEITNLAANLEVVLKGYNNHIKLGNGVSFGLDSMLNIENASMLYIANGTRFGKLTSLTLESNCQVRIEKAVFGDELFLSCGLGGEIILNRNGIYGKRNEIIVNANCHMLVGEDILTSRECVLRAGDGHAIWNVLESKKRNFLGLDNVTIGNHVWLAQGAKILSPSIIGSGNIIGTSAVVKGNFPNNCILGGVTAHILKENAAWSANPLSEEMTSSCGNSYAIPTIKLEKIEDTALSSCTKITNIYKYFERLNNLKNKLLIIAVKDIIGCCLNSDIKKAMRNLGLKAEFLNGGWRGYIAVIDNQKVIYEKIGEINEALNYEKQINNFHLEIESKPLHSGNQAIIKVNDYDYAVNERGFNIVLFDKRSHQMADSVCFDTHVTDLKCIRKVLTC